MRQVTMRQPVTVSQTGEVTTLAALAEAGRIRFEEEKHWRDRTTPAYFAVLVDPAGNELGAWQIGRTAYASRVSSGWTFGEDPKPQQPEPVAEVRKGEDPKGPLMTCGHYADGSTWDTHAPLCRACFNTEEYAEDPS